MKRNMLALFTAAILFLSVLTGCGASGSEDKSGVEESAATSQTTDATTDGEQEATSDASTGDTAPASDLPALPENIQEAGKIVIGVKADFAPFGYVDENGNNVGYDLELGKKLAEYAFGDPNAVEFEIVTSSNRIPYLTSGKVDLLLASMAITDERLEEINFTDIYMSTGHLILTNADNSEITSLDDLNSEDKTILLIDGTTGAAAAEKYCPDANFLYYQTWSEALSALKAGRGDAIIHDESVLYETAAADSSVKIIGSAFENTWVAGGVRKEDTEWLAWLNAALEKMQQEDYFYTEFQNWFSDWSNIPEGLPRAGAEPITVESKGFVVE